MGDPQPLHPPAQWSASYWLCGRDCGICCKTLCCPCVVYAQNKQDLDEGSNAGSSHFWRDCCAFISIPVSFYALTNMALACLGVLYPDPASAVVPSLECSFFCSIAGALTLATYTARQRARLREHEGLPEAPCPDELAYFCCPGMSLCQEAAQLQHCKQEAWALVRGSGYRRVELAPPQEQSME